MTISKKVSKNILHPKIGWIWCLHRVVPSRSLYKSNRDLEITPSFLESIIAERLKKGFHFVDLESFFSSASLSPRKHKLIHITFDDGFEDVFLYAYPILKKYNIPFTLYVTTDMPDGKADLWWLQLEQFAHGNKEWFESAIKEIYKQGNNIAAAMHTLTSSKKDPTLCPCLSLTWEQIRIMVSDGLCTVGSHGVSHSALSLLTAEDAKKELDLSKKRLTDMLGVEIRHFSYPHSKFNVVTNQLVWQSGYKTAVVGYGGLTRFSRGNRFFNREFIIQP